MFNIGDIIFQLFALLVPIFFIIIIVFFVRSLRKRKEQLDRIEKKLDIASGQTPEK